MLRSQVFSAIRWTAGARLLSQAVTWAITLIVIRFLQPADYGLLAMATIFLSVLMMIADLGFVAGLVQRFELRERELRQAFGIVIALHLALAVLLAALAPLIARFFVEPRLTSIIHVLALQFPIGALAIIPDALLQRQLEFRKRSLVELAAATSGALTTLAIAVAGGGVWALVAGSMTTQVVKAIGINIVAPYLHPPSFALSGMRRFLASGGQVTASQLIWSVFMQADSFIAGKWLGKEALGHYSLSMHLASLPTQRISALVAQVAFPAFSRIQHDMPRIVEHTLLGTRILALVMFPVLWGMSSVAPEIVRAILGPNWIDAIVPLQILTLIMPLRTIVIFLGNPIAGLGRFDVGLSSSIVLFVVMVPAFAVGVQWGLLGLCLAWLVAMPVVSVVNMWQNLRVIGVRLRTLLGAMARPALAAALMYGAVVLCRQRLEGAVSDPVRLAILIIAGMITFAIATLAVNRSGCAEALELARGVLGRSRARSG